MHPSPAATRAVRGWARTALLLEGGASVEPTGRVDLPTGDLLAAVTRHRMAELLGAHAPALGLPDDVADPIARRLRADRPLLVVRLMELARIEPLLADAGVRWLLVKGPALAAQTTGDPAARGRGDIDLFVSPSDVLAVMRVLETQGWAVRRPRMVAGSWGWRHMLDKSYELTLDGPSSTIDLHWRLDPTHHALPDFETAWARRSEVDLGGRPVPTLSPRDALTHACHHAAKDEWRWMRSLVDVHRLARSPGVWTPGPTHRVDRWTLRITAESIGLPPGVPADVLRSIAGVPARIVARGMAAQARPVHESTSVPGVGIGRLVRYRIAASASPADVRRTAVAVLAPLDPLDGLSDASAWTAVPRLLARQARWMLRRLTHRLAGRPDPTPRHTSAAPS